MSFSTITAISPLDGRYSHQTEQLRPIVSEYALIFYRLQIEISWLLALAENAEFAELSPLTNDEQQALQDIIEQFNETQALRIKQIEEKTNHDVKAIEYYIREKCEKHHTLKRVCPFIHFGCTSEDINNLAYALILKITRDSQLVPALQRIIQRLAQCATDTADIAMLSRTHGQCATPTTLGKEFKNFAARLSAHTKCWREIPIMGKCNGAVGNYNAHVAAYPAIDWPAFSKKFVESLGLSWNPYTTQIEPHDFLAQWLNALNVCHTILIDFCRDMWGYIALNYFIQKKSNDEVGSSTMPHKINPIDFENAEGNLGIGIALATHLSQKLPISRWQRDLTDSTVLRNLGCVFGYAIVAYQSLQKGLEKLLPNRALLDAELAQHWEVLAEPIQTIMRKQGITDAYEQLKGLTRGELFTQHDFLKLIDLLDVPASVKNELKVLTPEQYLGLAIALAKKPLKD